MANKPVMRAMSRIVISSWATTTLDAMARSAVQMVFQGTLRDPLGEPVGCGAKLRRGWILRC